MRKTFKYRLYPTATQAELLRMQLSEACRLYNAALQERRDAYRTHRKSLNYYDQASQLKEIRDAGSLALPNYHCAQDVLKRVRKRSKHSSTELRRDRSRDSQDSNPHDGTTASLSRAMGMAINFLKSIFGCKG